MSLYEVILFLQLHKNKFKYVVENVRPYYDPLIEPSVTIDRHLYWANFEIKDIKAEKMYNLSGATIDNLKDFNLSNYKKIKNKRQVIRNQVNYEIGRHILESAMNIKKNYQQGCLFGEETEQ
jgi:DNA (cytosine-5)-methyltransferase 1